MKIPKVFKDPTDRVTFALRQTTIAAIAAYNAHYTEVHQDEISEGMLVELMLRAFMTDDKAFIKGHPLAA